MSLRKNREKTSEKPKTCPPTAPERAQESLSKPAQGRTKVWQILVVGGSLRSDGQSLFVFSLALTIERSEEPSNHCVSPLGEANFSGSKLAPQWCAKRLEGSSLCRA